MNEQHSITAAVHMHSDWSYDGEWPLDRLAACFARRGCRVLLMSEHDRGFDEARWQAYRQACQAASTDRLLLVPGMEYSDPTNTIHILTWGEAPFLGADLPTGELLERAEAAGLYTVLAHPERKNAWRRIEPAWARRLRAAEVWNRKSDGFAPSPPAWSFAHEHGLMPFVGLDFHRRKQMFPAVMRLHGVADVSEKAVREALEQGRVTGHVLGIDLTRFESGLTGAAARLAEGLRQTARRVLKPRRGRSARVSAHPSDEVSRVTR